MLCWSLKKITMMLLLLAKLPTFTSWIGTNTYCHSTCICIINIQTGNTFSCVKACIAMRVVNEAVRKKICIHNNMEKVALSHNTVHIICMIFTVVFVCCSRWHLYIYYYKNALLCSWVGSHFKWAITVCIHVINSGNNIVQFFFIKESDSSRNKDLPGMVTF